MTEKSETRSAGLILGGIAAGVLALMALGGSESDSGDSGPSTIRVLVDQQRSGASPPPSRSGSNFGTPSAGKTPAEAADSRETTAPGGDDESTATTRYEQAAETTSQTGGGPSQQTVTSGGVTQDDDESDQDIISMPTRYEEAEETLSSTGSGAGNRRFTQG